MPVIKTNIQVVLQMFSEKKHLERESERFHGNAIIISKDLLHQMTLYLLHKYDLIVIYTQGEITTTPIHNIFHNLTLLKIPPQLLILFYHNEYDSSSFPNWGLPAETGWSNSSSKKVASKLELGLNWNWVLSGPRPWTASGVLLLRLGKGGEINKAKNVPLG